MRILALDYGDKRIGLAISDEEGRVALPYGVLENKGRKFTLDQLEDMMQKEEVEKLLIGLPVSMHGVFSGDGVGLKDIANEQMQKVLAFIDDCRRGLPVPVETIDERLSTKEAERRVEGTPEKVRAQKDAIAAAIILQSYLDRNRESC